MNREFLDLYNTELQLLNEHARQFAEEYPGIAERLGGILEDRVDPLIGGLLEGAAFLAAPGALQAQTRIPRVHRESAGTTRPALSRADAFDDDGQGEPGVWRSGAPRRRCDS